MIKLGAAPWQPHVPSFSSPVSPKDWLVHRAGPGGFQMAAMIKSIVHCHNVLSNEKGFLRFTQGQH